MPKTGTVPMANQDLASAVAEAEEQYVAAHPECAKAGGCRKGPVAGRKHQDDSAFFSPFPLFIESGKGSVLTDVDGNRYVDFINEFTAALFGHSNDIVLDTTVPSPAKA